MLACGGFLFLTDEGNSQIEAGETSEAGNILDLHIPMEDITEATVGE